MTRRSLFALVLAPLLPWPADPGIRVSSVTGDPGRRLWLQKAEEGFVPHITLDGKEATVVQTADETAGLLIRCVTDKDGEPYLNSLNDEFVMETLRGDVKVNWIKNQTLARQILRSSFA